jgi:hypothetical protein
MVANLIEFDCSASDAVSRIALNRAKGELVVIFSTQDTVYLYSDLDEDIFYRLTAPGVSFGALLADIKKRAKVRKVKEFPKKTAKYKRRDYSESWLQLLEAPNGVKTVDSLTDLLHIVAEMDQNLPPSKPPPGVQAGAHRDSGPAARAAPHAGQDNRRQRFVSSMVNSFAALDLDDDDDADEVPNGSRRGGAGAAPVRKRSIQCRYLSIRVICGIAEAYRTQATEHQRTKEYSAMAAAWVSAHDSLLCCREDTDGWYALSLGPARALQEEMHDPAQLAELLGSLQVLGEHTEEEKARALGWLHKRLSYVQEKLNPMLRERDAVKSSMGVDRWTNNPAPTMTYAERRAQWERDQKELQAAIELIEPLSFRLLPA